jgi:hypothetical protein
LLCCMCCSWSQTIMNILKSFDWGHSWRLRKHWTKWGRFELVHRWNRLSKTQLFILHILIFSKDLHC